MMWGKCPFVSIFAKLSENVLLIPVEMNTIVTVKHQQPLFLFTLIRRAYFKLIKPYSHTISCTMLFYGHKTLLP